MEYIRGFLYDSLAQTTIIGPLASFVVGIILAKVFGNTGGNSPSVVERRVIIIERRVTERREERRPSSDADPFLVGLALFGAVALAAWAYVAFLAEIVRWLDLGIRSAAALTLGFFAWSFVSTGMSGRWLFEAAVTFGTLAFAAWLVGVPPETISAEVSAFARSMNFMKFWNEGLDTAVGELSAAGLKSVADMARKVEGVAALYDGPVGAVAVRWTAAAYHEELCRRRGVPPEAVDDIWAYDPFAEGLEPDFLAARAVHEAARESEKEAVRVASELNRALWGTLREAYAALSDEGMGDAIRTALDALPDGVSGIAAGRRVSLIRLHWDCLAIWQEVRSGDWPGAGESRKRFEEFVGLVHEAATGTSLSDLPSVGEEGGGPARNDQSMRASADKALLSWLAQEADNGPSPVAVGDPVPPKGMEPGNHRFLAYLPRLDQRSKASAGPANWRRRAGRSLSTARV